MQESGVPDHPEDADFADGSEGITQAIQIADTIKATGNDLFKKVASGTALECFRNVFEKQAIHALKIVTVSGVSRKQSSTQRSSSGYDIGDLWRSLCPLLYQHSYCQSFIVGSAAHMCSAARLESGKWHTYGRHCIPFQEG